MSEVQTVPPVSGEAPRTCRCRFLAVENPTAKSPKFRYQLALSGALKGAVLEGPIFQNADGSWQVKLPGEGTFRSLKADQDIEEVNGRTFYADNPEGKAKLQALPKAIHAAFMHYQTTMKADQLVTI